jgi:hypothetical protein
MPRSQRLSSAIPPIAFERPEPATGLRRIRSLWPWAYLALAGVITLGWAIWLGWAAVALVQWLIG